ALVYQGQTLSYTELNIRANRLAHQLIALGVTPDQPVAICVARSPAMVVGLLAVLKAGGAYVPLDPAYPGERLVRILNDVAPSVILADEAGCVVLGREALAGLTVLDPNLLPDQADRNPQIPALTSRHLAYVIYTSGSTGTPKGVMVEHGSLLNLHGTLTERAFAYSPAPYRVSLNASISFDAALQNLLGLLNGYTLVIVPQDVRADSAALLQFLARTNLDVLDCTPMQLEMLLAAGLHQHQKALTLLIGGEPISVQTWQTVAGIPQLTAYNVYGPTECTVDATLACIEPAHPSPTIGRPLANTRLYLLDKFGCPVPLGVVGELYIGGAGVARGYLNRPELTAERFLVDPFNDKPGARMYKTGDLARYLPDGNLEFLGRNDHQVKIRGFRIELGEIETRLLEHPAVSESVVLALGEGQDKRLVAYVVAQADDGLVNRLREHLSASLPEYMVPSAFVRLDAFPLTPNSKLDRRALPAPGEDAFARQIYQAPQGEMETALASIWRELLGVEQISRHDNFFALGGHSLLAMRVMNRVTALGIELPLTTLFKSPSLGAFAEVMQARMGQSDIILSSILPISREGELPLSFAQQRLWFLTQLEGVSETYHIPMALRLSGQLDIVAWQKALDTLFARHEALRSVFVFVDGQPQVRLLEPDSGLLLSQYDLRGVPDADEVLERLSTEEAHASFDLKSGPLIRAALIRLTNDEYQFLLTLHHIISDGWSANVLIQELNTLYTVFMDGQSDPLPPLAIQYPDYAAWQRQWLSAERIQAQSDYWRAMLADAPVLLDLPTDRPRPPEQSFAGQAVPITLDVELTAALKRLSEQHGVTLFMTLLSAWSVVLSRLSGQENVVIGTPSAGRSRQEVEPLIGFFVNTLALRMDLSDELNVTELLARVRQTALAAQEHQDLPFEQVVEIVQPPRRLAHTPLFQVMFAWQNNESTDWKLPKLAVSPVDQAVDVVKFDLELGLSEEEGRIVGALSYATALFDSATMERQVGYLYAVLQAMVVNPQQPIGEIDILAPAERKLLLETWNTTESVYPEALCIHQLFEQQVEKTPQTTALVYQEQALSYAELNTRANRLAHQLIALGVVPDQRVAICVSRSPAMIVGVLAILKAGGAYVPLDSVYTGERLAHILTDAAPAIVLADDTGRNALGEKMLTELTVLDPNILPDQPEDNPQVPALTAQHLAYVIYTSGSTGTPKGVMVEHRNIQRLFDATESWYHFTRQDVWCLFHSIAFDFSVWELWGALRYGAKLVLVPHAIARSPQELHQFVCQHGITVLNQTPSAFKALIASYVANPLPDQLRYIIFGGEALDPGMLRPWYHLREETSPRLVNMYGITETTVHVTYRELNPHDVEQITSPIGARIPDLTLYLLDKYGQPVPLGVTGELYVGGAGVARGYLNRPELTAERFLIDPFSDQPDARMYRTGDLARYLPEGNLVFVGRNDQQVKIRGFRIEPGEIEARLVEHPAVSESVVLALGQGQDKRLVAYVVAPADEGLANSLRTYLSAILPDYMVPTAFVRLDAFPLTPNGKLDRRALPAPDNEAFARQIYAAPQGKTEIALATIWRELLGIEQISRHDSFFALGGHSLLAVRMIERLRHQGLALAVRDLFQSPVLSELSQTLRQHRAVVVPPNVITPATTALTPEMLPLIDLTQADIDCLVEQVPGGMANIQDIYALSPLQDGILFHHLLANEGDPYLIVSQMLFADRALLDRYFAAVQQVVERHDILRTAFLWQGLSVPVQVVWCQAPLSVTELALDPADGAICDQLTQRFSPRHYRLDLNQAPLLRFVVAQETDGRWRVLQLQHHLIGDHTTMEVMNQEIQAYLIGQGNNLPVPAPFRNLIAQARLGVNQAEYIRFFTDMLTEVDEPTLPFGLTEVRRNDLQMMESHQMLSQVLNDRLRSQARRLGVSLATLCHLAWAQVLSRTSGQEKVVFGTVLFGRMAAGEGADSGMGLFINTLPLRLDIDDTPVQDSVRAAHARLAELLDYEHASLALAQRCSRVQGEMPLFSALLNYRHNTLQVVSDETMSGIEFLGGQESSNYPFSLSVEDFGNALGLTAEVVQPYEPERVCGYMRQALENLVEALELAPETPVRTLSILPEAERALLVETRNATETQYPDPLCIHQLFEQQVERAPEATALAHQEQTFSYAELNACANRLAHQLIAQGVTPDQRVAICVERSPAMVVALLAVLKAGGAYVPLDLTYPGERLAYILNDTAPAVVLADAAGRVALGEATLAGLTVLDPNTRPDQPDSNPLVLALTPQHLAYVIYTSGSTGQPKGVTIEHQAIYQRNLGFNETYAVTAQDRVLQFSSFAFDASIEEFFSSLSHGATLVMRDDRWLVSVQEFISLIRQHRITVMSLPTLFWSELAALPLPECLRLIIIGGEAVQKSAVQAWFAQKAYRPQLLNTYGPTENTVIATCKAILSPEDTRSIGRPVKNTGVYLLDPYGQPVPLGCTGEMYIGGVGVARGYLNRPELSAERFIPDPFSPIAGARMYRTGDLARYLPDGDLEFLGRNDEQVKIRGFRIEPGEIEARLT
uniref:non-ribosomal peptide synthetase n=1 Tax=Photorhabdus sp. RM322S TaxID=3342825 RepID=UPI0036DBE101